MPVGAYIFEALRAAREGKALSQRELSAQVGLPQSHISKIEHGSVDLQISTLLALARALEVEMMLVPRKLVPAVEAIINGEKSVSSPRDDTALRAAADLNRIRNLARRLASSDKDGESQSRLQRAVRELANLRLTEKDLERIRAVLDELKNASRNPENAREELLHAARQLLNLRNAAARHASESAPLPAVRPAYSLDEDADA